MDFIIGVIIGATAITIVVMFSLAKAAKQSDEIESDLSEKITRIKRKSDEDKR